MTNTKTGYQIIDIIEDLDSETEKSTIVAKRMELAKLMYEFVFSEEIDNKTLKSFIEDDTLDELFSDLNKIETYINGFISKNIKYIEEDYAGTDFLEGIEKGNRELAESSERLQELKKELSSKQEKKQATEKNRGEIEKMQVELADIDSILDRYKGVDIDTLRSEYGEKKRHFEELYNKSPKEIKGDYEAVQKQIDELYSFYNEYEDRKKELETLSAEYDEIASESKKHQELIEIYRTHFEANLRLNAGDANLLAKDIKERLDEYDEKIKEKMEAIKTLQQTIKEKL